MLLRQSTSITDPLTMGEIGRLPITHIANMLYHDDLTNYCH